MPRGNRDDAEDLLVTARITPTFDPVADVILHYRVMFAGEVDVAMNDSGTGGDAAAGDGIWSGLIPASAATPGQMVRYYVTAPDTGGRSSRWPLFPDPLDSEAVLRHGGGRPVHRVRICRWCTSSSRTWAADTRTGHPVLTVLPGRVLRQRPHRPARPVLRRFPQEELRRRLQPGPSVQGIGPVTGGSKTSSS